MVNWTLCQLTRRRWWHPAPVLLAWKSPWMEEPGRLQSMGSLRVGQDWATSLSLSCIEGNGNPLQCSCLENPKDGGSWWAAVYGVAQSRTRLKRLSSSSSSIMKYIHHYSIIQSRFIVLRINLCSAWGSSSPLATTDLFTVSKFYPFQNVM